MNNSAKIKDLEKQIADLKQKDAIFAAMLPAERLAITLHDLLCRANHTDGCGWYYEIKDNVHEWEAGKHDIYMQKALNLLGFCKAHNLEVDTATEMVKLIRGY